MHIERCARYPEARPHRAHDLLNHKLRQTRLKGPLCLYAIAGPIPSIGIEWTVGFFGGLVVGHR